jgi:glycine oxidase
MRRNEAMRATVVGAGVAGLATALSLAERGAKVGLVERSPELGGNASWLAGGMLAPFCEGESAPSSVVELGRQAIDWWAARVPGVVREGTLVVAPPRDAAEIDRFAARTSGYRRVDAAEIAALEPDLAGRFHKGLFIPEEGHLDPRQAMRALVESLRRRGVDLRFGVDGEALGAAGVIVDCRGFAARRDLAELRGVRGEMVRLRTPEIALTRAVRLLHPRHSLYVVPRANGEFMIGATMIESADKGAVSARSAIELLSAAYALHPAFGEAEILEMSADVRPAFPDNEPRVEERSGRIFVNGFYRHGFLLAPAFAAKAADLAFAQAEGEPHLGRWLVKNSAGLRDIEPPSRQGDRPDPFAGFFESETEA